MISITNTQKKFKGKSALNNLNLTVNPGEIYGLLGSNGAGKSTTINLLLGFYPPDSGSLSVCGFDPVENQKQVRSTVGYIPENVNLYPHLNGIENLDYFCKLAGLSYPDTELTEFLLTSGLEKEAHKKRIDTYSKGMRQKVGIAIALAKKAKVYLLDEPASGLDPSASNELSITLQNIAREGAAILMASHDIFRVRETCTTIGILKNGVLLKEISAAKVSSNELEKIYLDYMQN